MTDRDDAQGDESNSPTPPALIRPPNKMKHKVTAGGRFTGPSFDPDLLKQAEEESAAAFEAFDQALDEIVERLVVICQCLEDEPARRAQHLEELKSTARELAGTGAQSGYDLLSRFGESLLTFLDKCDVGDETIAEVVRVHVDSMRLIYIQERTGDGGEVGQRLSHGLNATLVRFTDESPA